MAKASIAEAHATKERPAVGAKARTGSARKKSLPLAADEELKVWGELIRDHPTVEKDVRDVRQKLIQVAASDLVRLFSDDIRQSKAAHEQWQREYADWDHYRGEFSLQEPLEPLVVDICSDTIERAILECNGDNTHLPTDSLYTFCRHLDWLIGHGVGWLLETYPWLLNHAPASLRETELVEALGASICAGKWVAPLRQRFLSSCRAAVVVLAQQIEAPPQITSISRVGKNSIGSHSNGLLLEISGHPTEEALDAAYERAKIALIDSKIVAPATRKQGRARDWQLHLDRYHEFTAWRAQRVAAGESATIDNFVTIVTDAAGSTACRWSHSHESNIKLLQRAKRQFRREAKALFAPTLEAPEPILRHSWITYTDPDIPF